MKLILNNTSRSSVRLFFLIISLIIFIVTAVNALNILYFNAIGNDQCAWRTIDNRKDVLLITDVVKDGVTDKAGIKDGDVLLKLNGESFKTGRRAVEIVNNIPRGGSVLYTIERDGKIMEINVEIVKVFNVIFLANYLFDLVCFIVGFIVIMSRPEGVTQRYFYYFGVLLMINGANLQIITKYAPLWVSDIFFGITFIFFQIVFVNFAYLFPAHRSTKNKNLIITLLILICLSAYILNIINRSYLFLPDYLIIIFGNIGIITLTTGISIFAHTYFKYIDVQKRKPLRPVLISAVLSLLAFLYILIINRTNEYIIFIKPALLLPGLLITVFPLGLGYSIFKYRLMDTAFIVKKSIIYGAITAAIAGIYLIIVFGVGTFFYTLFGRTENETLGFISIVIIAFVFDPLKRYLQNSVDKVFYRERYSYQKALLLFSRALPFKMNLNDILDSVVNTISGTMHIEKIAVAIMDDENDITCFSKNIPKEYCRYSKEPEGIISLLEAYKAPINLSTLYDERHYHNISDLEKENIEKGDIQLIIPMIAHNKVIGFINTGPKLSEKPYSQEDTDLLFTVANQTAIAVENSRLYEKEKQLFKVQEEIKLAYKIQSEWIPKSPPHIKGYEIAGSTTPAEVVGGDYFDYIEIDKNKIAFCIGDVSGKGLPAALMMANTQAILKSQTLSALTPADCIEKTNRLICSSSSDEMFVTLFYGVINLKNNIFTYTNAGHNYPVLYSNSNVSFLKDGGFPLGVQSNAKYIENSLELMHDSVLLMYTDGLTETFNNKWELFGEERLFKAIKEYSSLSPDEIIRKILEDVKDFRKDKSVLDDLTMVVIKRK